MGKATETDQELCESRGDHRGLPSPNNPTVSVDVKQHFNRPKGQRSGAGQDLTIGRLEVW